MDPVIASSLISGIVDSAGTIINNSTNVGNARRTQRSARSLMDSQNAFNAAEAQKSREWNSPMHQMAMFKEAGLNPNLVASNVSGSSPAVAAGVSVPDLPTGFSDNALSSLGSRIGDAYLKYSEYKRNLAEADDFQASADQKRDLTPSQKRLNETLADMNVAQTIHFEHLDKLTDKQCEEIESTIKVNQAKLKEIDAHVQEMFQSIVTGREQQRLLSAQADEREYRNEHEMPREVEAHLRYVKAQTDELISRIGVNKAQAEYLSHQADYVMFQVAEMYGYGEFATRWLKDEFGDDFKPLFEFDQEEKKLELDFQNATFDSKVWGENISNYISPFLDVIDSVLTFFTYKTLLKGMGKSVKETHKYTYDEKGNIKKHEKSLSRKRKEQKPPKSN